MDPEAKTFKVGRGGTFFLFLFVAVAGLAGAGVGVSHHEWAMTGMLLVGGLFAGALCLWMPGVLKVDDHGIEVQRRRGTQALSWAEIKSAIWDRTADGLASMASDNWTITISGDTTKIILSGPMVEKPKEVRALLEQRFPRQP
jgi:hypothetical protein